MIDDTPYRDGESPEIPTPAAVTDTDDYDVTTEGLQRLVRDVYGIAPECQYLPNCGDDGVAIYAKMRGDTDLLSEACEGDDGIGEDTDLLSVACEHHAEMVESRKSRGKLTVAPVRGTGYDPTFSPAQLDGSLAVLVYQ